LQTALPCLAERFARVIHTQQQGHRPLVDDDLRHDQPLISGAFTSQFLPAIHGPHQHIQQQQVGLEGQMQWQRAALLCAIQVHFHGRFCSGTMEAGGLLPEGKAD